MKWERGHPVLCGSQSGLPQQLEKYRHQGQKRPLFVSLELDGMQLVYLRRPLCRMTDIQCRLYLKASVLQTLSHSVYCGKYQMWNNDEIGSSERFSHKLFLGSR